MTRPKRQGVMLAVPADERKVRNLGKEFYVQPKLNGERGLTEIFEGHPVIVSSYANSFEFLDNIKNGVKKAWTAMDINLPFDGEIYKHGWSRERIDSALRRTVNYNPDVEELEYHIFDIKLPISQSDRLLILDMVKVALEDLDTPLRIISTYLGNQENWMAMADIFLEQGFEGAMLRKIDHPVYDPRRLTGQMLKYKPTEIDAYIIKGVEEAISLAQEPLGMIGSFLVQGDDEIQFKVGAGKLTHQQRRTYWAKKETLIGKVLITKQGKILTTEGIPTCAVAVEIKED